MDLLELQNIRRDNTMFYESFLPTYVLLSLITSGVWFNLPPCKLEPNTPFLEFNENNDTSFKDNENCDNDKCNEKWMEKIYLFYNNWSNWSKCYMKLSGVWIRHRERTCNNHIVCKNTTIQEEKLCRNTSYINKRKVHKWKHRKIKYRGSNHTFIVVLNSSEKFIKRLGTNLLKRSANSRKVPKRVYSKWSRWTICSRSCFTQRYRWCKKVEVCGNEVIRQSAYCYTEGSHCQTWIQNKIKGSPVIEVNQIDSNDEGDILETTKAPLYNQLPGSDTRVPASSSTQSSSTTTTTTTTAATTTTGSTWSQASNNDHAPVCGITFNNFSRIYSPHYGNMLRIIGGRPTQSGKWPWIVALLNRFKEAFCGGTLVTKQWVLTAAHCVRKRLYVSIGDYNLSQNEGTELLLRVKKTIIHPKYNAETVDNDVALLKLPKQIPSNIHSGIACLPRPRQHLPIKRLCTIVGWGKRSTTDAYGTDILHEAQVPIVSTQSCRGVYEDYYITNNMFCAGYRKGRMDSCSGDSGGPLLCPDKYGKWTVFGITSFGEGCGKKGKYGIYTKLPNFVKWIDSVINS